MNSTAVFLFLLSFGTWRLLAGDRAAPPDFPAAEAAARRLSLAPGLHLGVWAAEPQLENGVAFAFDRKGFCYVAETHRYGVSVFDITQNTNWLTRDLSFRSVADRVGFLEKEFEGNPGLLTRDSEDVRRLEPGPDGRRVARADTLASGFNTAADGTAAGVAVRDDGVWFANIPNLWRLALTPTNDQPGGDRQRLAFGFGVHIGVTGHDLHGLTFGPDGRLYMSFGDRGLCVTNAEGRVLDLPDTGGVLRCEADGSRLEVFCFGLRNPQSLAFDDFGNLWTVDNDTAGPDPCRVLHLVEGGDYGWRCSYQHQPNFGPWVEDELWRGGRDGILPLAGTVSQGPSGLEWYPGTGFGSRLQGRFLHCDFPAGVVSFGIEPHGASYVLGRHERFLWNLWPTDARFGPDGAAYVLDWVGGWQLPNKGRIYRITDADAANAAEAEVTRRRLASDFDHQADTTLLEWLRSADRRVRIEAQFALARRGPAVARGLVGAVMTEGPPAPRLHALWALGQIARGRREWSDARAVADELGGRLARGGDVEVRGQAVLWAAEVVSPQAVRWARALAEEPLARSRFLAIEALARLCESSPSGAESAWVGMDRLAAYGSGSRDLFIDEACRRLFSAALQRNRPGEAASLVAQTQREALPTVRRLAVQALRRIRDPRIAVFLSDPDPDIAVETARAIYDAPIAGGYPALAKTLDGKGPAASLTRAIRAAERLGGADGANRLVSVATDAGRPPAARREALLALADWPSPNPIDPIVGLWRPQSEGPVPSDLGRTSAYETGVSFRRAVGPARAAFEERAAKLFTEPQFAPLAARVARALGARKLCGPIALALADGPSGESAVALLDALAALGASEAPEAIDRALASDDATLRVAAAALLGSLDPAAGAREADKLVRQFLNRPSNTPLGAAQKAVASLAANGSAAGESVRIGWWREFTEGRWPAPLALDLVEMARLRPGPEWRERLARADEAAAAAGSLGRWRTAMVGGDAGRGEEIFFGHAAAQCVRCHQVAGRGGTVGPRLDGVGSRQSRELLLESVVFPNVRIAAGFESAVLTLRDGRTVSGIVQAQGNGRVTVATVDESGAPVSESVPENEIIERQRGRSAMPEGFGSVLKAWELRDLIEFLASLR